MKKGLSISTNVLVALAIALIVLLALVSMFMGIVPGAGESLGCEADFRIQCNRYISAGGCKESSGLGVFDTDPLDATKYLYINPETSKCATGHGTVGVDEDTVRNICCGKS